MSIRIFHDFETTNWARVSTIVAGATLFWVGLISIIPVKYHGPGVVILGALQSMITLFMKSGQSPQREVKEAIEAVKDKVEEEKRP